MDEKDLAYWTIDRVRFSCVNVRTPAKAKKGDSVTLQWQTEEQVFEILSQHIDPFQHLVSLHGHVESVLFLRIEFFGSRLCDTRFLDRLV
eukprot:scaffold4498_cov154-Amphora_coffeaeformis.AAC.3